LFLTVVEIGDDVAGHVDQENTADAAGDQFRIQDVLDLVELLLIKRIGHVPVPPCQDLSSASKTVFSALLFLT
jgi:hypothetical protein